VRRAEHILYDYPLRRALREGFYTKDVHICVRTFDANGLGEEDVDRAAIEYSLDRLDRKRAAMAGVQAGFPLVKPVCVFFARDIAQAEQVAGWLIGTGRVEEREVLLTHSAMTKSEDELERLLSIEEPANPVRVVVNVMDRQKGGMSRTSTLLHPSERWPYSRVLCRRWGAACVCQPDVELEILS
jgi:hypothetical protein